MSAAARTVVVVGACLRDGRGGSPTAVLDETPLDEDARRDVPRRFGTSHAVFMAATEGEASLRFFTAEGELPACGHGTVAALAVLAARAGTARYRATLRASGRTFVGEAWREGEEVRALFDPGAVDLRDPTEAESTLVSGALGVPADLLAPGTRVASVGRPRLLVPVRTCAAVSELCPDLDRLRRACDALGLLGCYVHSVPTPEGRLAARMFAPSIGVPEDIANANSTACLAAHLAGDGSADITADMGDHVGRPATIVATARPGPHGTLVRVGGTARIARVLPFAFHAR